MFDVVNGESLDTAKINDLILNLEPEKKIEFIEKLFIRNKLHNRFSI